MPKIKESFIQCTHCGTKFRSPFFIGDTKTFSHAVQWGNRVKCPSCEITIDCNERNMSYVLEGEPDTKSRAEDRAPVIEPTKESSASPYLMQVPNR